MKIFLFLFALFSLLLVIPPCLCVTGGCGSGMEYNSIGTIDINGLEGAPGGNCTFDDGIGFPYAHIQHTPLEGCYLNENNETCHTNAVYVSREQNIVGYTQCETVMGSIGVAINTTSFEATITSQNISRSLYTGSGFDPLDDDHYSFYGIGGQTNVIIDDPTYIYTNLITPSTSMLVYCTGVLGGVTDHDACAISLYSGFSPSGSMSTNGHYSQNQQVYLINGATIYIFDLSDMSVSLFPIPGAVGAKTGTGSVLYDDDDIYVQFVIQADLGNVVRVYDISNAPSTITLIDQVNYATTLLSSPTTRSVKHPQNPLLIYHYDVLVTLNNDFTINSVALSSSGSEDPIIISEISPTFMGFDDQFALAYYSEPTDASRTVRIYCASDGVGSLQDLKLTTTSLNEGPDYDPAADSDIQANVLIPNFPALKNQIFMSGKFVFYGFFDSDSDRNFYEYDTYGFSIGYFDYCGADQPDGYPALSAGTYDCGDSLAEVGTCCDLEECVIETGITPCNAEPLVECYYQNICDGLDCIPHNPKPEGALCFFPNDVLGICNDNVTCTSVPWSGTNSTCPVGESCTLPNGATGVCNDDGVCVIPPGGPIDPPKIRVVKDDYPVVFRQEDYEDDYSDKLFLIIFLSVFGFLLFALLFWWCCLPFAKKRKKKKSKDKQNI